LNITEEDLEGNDDVGDLVALFPGEGWNGWEEKIRTSIGLPLGIGIVDPQSEAVQKMLQQHNVFQDYRNKPGKPGASKNPGKIRIWDIFFHLFNLSFRVQNVHHISTSVL